MQVLIKVFLLLFKLSLVQSLNQIPLYRSSESQVIYRAYDDSNPAFDNNRDEIKEKKTENEIWGNESILKLVNGLPTSKSYDDFIEVPKMSRLIRESKALFKTLQKFRLNGEVVLKSPIEMGKVMIFSGYGENGFISGFVALLLWKAGYNVTVIALPNEKEQRVGHAPYDVLLKELRMTHWIKETLRFAPQNQTSNFVKDLQALVKAQLIPANIFNVIATPATEPDLIAIQTPLDKVNDQTVQLRIPCIQVPLNSLRDKIMDSRRFNLLVVPEESSIEAMTHSISSIYSYVQDNTFVLFLEGNMGVEGNFQNFTKYSAMTLDILNCVKKSGYGNIISINSPMMYNEISGMISKSLLGNLRTLNIGGHRKRSNGEVPVASITNTNPTLVPTYHPDGIIFINFLPSYLLARGMRYKKITKEHKFEVEPTPNKNGGWVKVDPAVRLNNNNQSLTQIQPSKGSKYESSSSDLKSGLNSRAPLKYNNKPLSKLPQPGESTTPSNQIGSSTPPIPQETGRTSAKPSTSSRLRNMEKDPQKFVVLPTGGWQLDDVEMALVILDDLYNFMDDNIYHILKAHEEDMTSRGRPLKEPRPKIHFERPIVTSGRPSYIANAVNKVDGVLYVKKPLSQFDAPLDTVAFYG